MFVCLFLGQQRTALTSVLMPSVPAKVLIFCLFLSFFLRSFVRSFVCLFVCFALLSFVFGCSGGGFLAGLGGGGAVCCLFLLCFVLCWVFLYCLFVFLLFCFWGGCEGRADTDDRACPINRNCRNVGEHCSRWPTSLRDVDNDPVINARVH